MQVVSACRYPVRQYLVSETILKQMMKCQETSIICELKNIDSPTNE